MKSWGLVAIMIFFQTQLNSSMSYDWGFFAHRKIARLAVFSLPDPLFAFFRKNIEFLEAHAVDADKRRYAVVGEAENHYLDIDRYTHDTIPPNDVLPLRWDSAVAKFGEDSLRKHGIAPWNTYFVFIKLRNAFEKKDKSKILRHAVDLAHYVGDIHVPLHTTSNYNGQLTNQLGIHGFWETRLPELNWSSYSFKNADVAYLNTPLLTIWEIVNNCHLKVDSVLSFERHLNEQFSEQKYTIEQRGNQQVKTYSEFYSQAYADRLNGMVERQLQSAISTLANLWYTAWVDAGKPILFDDEETQESLDSVRVLPGSESTLQVRPHE